MSIKYSYLLRPVKHLIASTSTWAFVWCQLHPLRIAASFNGMRTHLAPQTEIRRLQTTHHLVEVDICFKMARVASGQEKPILKGSVCFSLVSVAKLWRLKGGWSTKVRLEMTGLIWNKIRYWPKWHEVPTFSQIGTMQYTNLSLYAKDREVDCPSPMKCKPCSWMLQACRPIFSMIWWWYRTEVIHIFGTFWDTLSWNWNVLEMLPTYILKKRFLLPSKVHCTSTSTKHLVSYLYHLVSSSDCCDVSWRSARKCTQEIRISGGLQVMLLW